jgi:hypothetical protein
VKVTAGLAIEVQDRGLGMSYEDLERINHLLDGSTRIDLSELLSDGRIGLAVVRELARRHDIKVRLQSNIFGGIAAAVVIPPQLLSEPERESRHRSQQQRASALPKRRTEPTTLDAAAPELTGRISDAAITQAHVLAPASDPTAGRVATRTTEPDPSASRIAARATEPDPTTSRIGARTTEPDPGTGRLATRTTEPAAGSAPEPIADQHSGQLVPTPGPRASISSQEPRPAPAEQSGQLHVPSPAPIPMAEPGIAAEPGARPAASVFPPTPAEQSGPIQVPAPLPIPTASVSRTGAAFGAAQPTQSGRRRRAEPEDDRPVLPVRAPGRSYDDLRAGGDGGITVEDQDDQPPPLPQRRGTHLREELLDPPAVTKPVPGHNTSLMKTFQAGRDNWQAEQNRDANTNRGDSWPTT